MKKKVITVELTGEAAEVYEKAKNTYKMKKIINSLLVQWGIKNGLVEEKDGRKRKQDKTVV